MASKTLPGIAAALATAAFGVTLAACGGTGTSSPSSAHTAPSTSPSSKPQGAMTPMTTVQPVSGSGQNAYALPNGVTLTMGQAGIVHDNGGPDDGQWCVSVEAKDVSAGHIFVQATLTWVLGHSMAGKVLGTDLAVPDSDTAGDAAELNTGQTQTLYDCPQASINIPKGAYASWQLSGAWTGPTENADFSSGAVDWTLAYNPALPDSNSK